MPLCGFAGAGDGAHCLVWVWFPAQAAMVAFGLLVVQKVQNKAIKCFFFLFFFHVPWFLIFFSVKVWGLKGGEVITDMKVSSSERGSDNTQYSAVLLCIMQSVFQVFYLSLGLRGSEAQEGLMYLLLH